MVTNLTLIVPHDLTVVRLRLAALEALLVRGERHGAQPADWQRRLLQLCGIVSESHQDLPLGPLCCLGDGGPATEGYWLRAEPVHLLADQDKVYLAARGAELGVSLDEAAALAAEFNRLFHEDQWYLSAPTPTSWYLRLPQAPQLRTFPPDHAMGWDLRPLLPQGADGLRLQAALTEIQMLFHASAVNARRSAAGHPTINSLWLWGGAVLPTVAPLPWTRLQGDDSLLRGVAAHGGVLCTSADGDAETWLAGEGSGLVLFDGAGDGLTELDERWFAPLLAALRNGRLGQLDIHLTSTPSSYRIDRRAARRWWRRCRPLATYAGDS